MKIYKYVIPTNNLNTGIFTIEMPNGADPISCSINGMGLSIWSTVYDDPEALMFERQFYIIATGEKFQIDRSRLDLIGRVELGDLPYIFHVFSVRD